MMQQRGYIVPLVLMLISMAVIMVTAMYYRGTVFVPFMSTMLAREQAKFLALSGVQVAMGQLVQEIKQQPADKQKAVVPHEKELLENILPSLNRWQEFSLKRARDGIDGTIKISVSCEAGKIDLNRIYDFNAKKFRGEGQEKGDWRKIMQLLLERIQTMMPGTSNLFESLEGILRERRYKFNDASELLTRDAFSKFAGTMFYEPPLPGAKSERPLYLMDLFTVYGGATLQPWVFSDSLLGVLGIKRAAVGDSNGRKEMTKEWLSKFTPTTNWSSQWNAILKPVYGVELQSLPNGIDSVLQERFDPSFFSVISYGTVAGITQRIYAIVERVKKTVNGKTHYEGKLRKFYWM